MYIWAQTIRDACSATFTSVSLPHSVSQSSRVVYQSTLVSPRLGQSGSGAPISPGTRDFHPGLLRSSDADLGVPRGVCLQVSVEVRAARVGLVTVLAGERSDAGVGQHVFLQVKLPLQTLATFRTGERFLA